MFEFLKKKVSAFAEKLGEMVEQKKEQALKEQKLLEKKEEKTVKGTKDKPRPQAPKKKR
ncbi:MAG: hypothetical protein HYW50_00680 [Candidatus Diapherotrites archaeon]|nr:hypothetical protein [Candidatus Diapherotrites archaeon]